MNETMKQIIKLTKIAVINRLLIIAIIDLVSSNAYAQNNINVNPKCKSAYMSQVDSESNTNSMIVINGLYRKTPLLLYGSVSGIHLFLNKYKGIKINTQETIHKYVILDSVLHINNFDLLQKCGIDTFYLNKDQFEKLSNTKEIKILKMYFNKVKESRGLYVIKEKSLKYDKTLAAYLQSNCQLPVLSSYTGYLLVKRLSK